MIGGLHSYCWMKIDGAHEGTKHTITLMSSIIYAIN